MTATMVINDLREWFATLPPDFAFLLALPFVIGLAAFMEDAIARQRRSVGSLNDCSDGKRSHAALESGKQASRRAFSTGSGKCIALNPTPAQFNVQRQ